MRVHISLHYSLTENIFSSTRHPAEQARSHGAIPFNLTNDPIAALHAATEGRGADAVLEIVGSPAALLLGIECARKGGVVVSCGVHTHEIPMPGNTLYNKNIRSVTSLPR